MTYLFEGLLWRWQGGAPAAWHFVTLPEDIGYQIRFVAGRQRGFGSVRVTVEVGSSRWATSLFPDTRTGSYLLPVKTDIRKREGLVDGQMIEVKLSFAN